MFLSVCFFTIYLILCWLMMKRTSTTLTRSSSLSQRLNTAFLWALTSALLTMIGYPIFTASLISIILSYFYATRIYQSKTKPNALLTVVPNLLDSSKAQVHLSNPADNFRRGHYVELIGLLSELSSIGITQITLTSPMFYKDKTLRGLRILERLTSPQWQVTGKAIHWGSKLWEIVVLATLRRIRTNQNMASLSLTQWYQITLTFKSAQKEI